MRLELLEYVHENLPEGFTPYYIYSIIVNEEEVGRITVRVGSDLEHYYDGHIGYTVFEEYQGHNYAYQGCLLLKTMIEFDHLIMTCDPHNKASQKVIQKLGCQYIETKVIPQYLRKFFNQDEKEKMIYMWR
ncbi:GNAT family N-acetyltransferase [Candidatus Stoquefichus massiliensis]|uniref:GNAT family N-acetyltransferase n=1 Tax=Candidatus Stoquefichus massiliensis TaxID=1470350 RepID=UPI00048436DA|nr:GNAT family N-acetyltransferase [Candidatus Stoquefichus massiliensis]